MCAVTTLIYLFPKRSIEVRRLRKWRLNDLRQKGGKSGFHYNGDRHVLSKDSRSNPFIRQNIVKIHVNFSGVGRPNTSNYFPYAIILITKLLDVDNEITIDSKKSKSMYNINYHIRPISPARKMHTCKYLKLFVFLHPCGS